MRSSYWMALAVVVGATAWIATGHIAGGDVRPAAEAPRQAAPAPTPVALPAVRFAWSTAEPQERRVVLRGRTEPNRIVTLRAETQGQVVEIAAERGTRLAAGDIVVRLADDDRPARLAEARALLAQRDVEFRASRALSERGFRADNQHAVAKAQLDAARAMVTRGEIEVRRATIQAPFAGVLEKRPVEKGDYLKEGDTVAVVVDLDPVIVVGHLTEADRSRIRPGQAGVARLATGQEIAVTLRYVAANADNATRTFRVELAAANPRLEIVGGVTAEILVPVERIAAHRITPALLALDEKGVLGIKTIDEADGVVFQPVRIVGDGPEGMWVTGLPERARVITVGQEFVRAGQKVRPVEATVPS
ncbi:MAG: efflux RND transporter periplasmic adaptor subunit [Alphaproteobacteria bacterium]|nr:efflux RND transporter periplasmic adaptor subunit [Alphaproteobacteria bacterium]